MRWAGGGGCSESQARRLDGTTGVLLTHHGYAPATVRRIWEMTCMLEQGSIVSKAAGGAGMLKYNVEGADFLSGFSLNPRDQINSFFFKSFLLLGNLSSAALTFGFQS